MRSDVQARVLGEVVAAVVMYSSQTVVRALGHNADIDSEQVLEALQELGLEDAAFALDGAINDTVDVVEGGEPWNGCDLDGDHRTALESVYGPEDDEPQGCGIYG